MTERTVEQYRLIDFLINNGSMTRGQIISRLDQILGEVPSEYRSTAEIEIEHNEFGDCYENLKWSQPESEYERIVRENRASTAKAIQEVKNRAEYERLRKLLGDA